MNLVTSPRTLAEGKNYSSSMNRAGKFRFAHFSGFLVHYAPPKASVKTLYKNRDRWESFFAAPCPIFCGFLRSARPLAALSELDAAAGSPFLLAFTRLPCPASPPKVAVDCHFGRGAKPQSENRG